MPIFLRRHIMMRGEYAKLMLEGKKRATIRLGKVVPKYDEVIIHSWGKPVAKARITKVTYKKVKELTDEDARRDGFKNKEELLRELRHVYGKVSPNDLVTIIEFEVIQRFNELVPEDPYLGLKPADIGRLALRYLRNDLNEYELKILEELGKGKSIRQVSKELTGSPVNRGRVRRIVRKALALLIKRGIIESRKRDEALDTDKAS